MKLPPARIDLGYNAVPESAEKEILKVFRSGNYSPGQKCHEFEEKWAKLHNAKYAVFVNSGTDALRLSLLAMKEKYGWNDGTEVAVTTQTFPATINVIIQSNLKPKFYDAGNPWNLEHQLRCQAEKDNIKAIIPVHLYGNPANEYTYELAKKHDWKVLEDSCETILNPLRGNVSCYSTYMAHYVTTGVGGMAITNDRELKYLIWSYANHGRRRAKHFEYDRIGYSCRATEFEAVMGLSQLKDIGKQIAERREIARKMSNIFFDHWRDFSVMEPWLYPDHTYMMFPIMIKEMSKIKKEKLKKYLNKNKIETRDMMPITNQGCYGLNEEDYPMSKQINKNGFYIGCHPGIREKDIQHLERVLQLFKK